MILLIGSQKGGTGKSTLATNLAVELRRRKRDVLIVDADPQKTSSTWAGRRMEENPNREAVPVVEATGPNIRATLKDLAKRYQDLIVDTGGYDGVEIRGAIYVCDHLIVPTKASQADLETLSVVNDLLEQARSLRDDGGPRASVVLSMCPTHAWNLEARSARDYVESATSMQLLESPVHDRKIYRDAMLAGCGVVELGNRHAASEIRQLADEVAQ